MDVPKPKEIIVPVDHADEDDESGLVFDEDNTINVPEVGDSQGEEDFHRVGGGGLIFPLLGFIAAIDTTEERSRSLLERNEKTRSGG